MIESKNDQLHSLMQRFGNRDGVVYLTSCLREEKSRRARSLARGLPVRTGMDGSPLRPADGAALLIVPTTNFELGILSLFAE